MNYYYKYKDNSDGKWLTIKVFVDSAFVPLEFAFDDDKALEIYQLLISSDKKQINRFLKRQIERQL
tara:strand:+ start:697 stop:894 length:198 start_codon:yes stop_codon:yes gene_type:complete